MSRWTAAALIAIALVLGIGGPAAAWADGENDEPIGVPSEPPTFEPPADLPESGPSAAPAGIYAVTDAYAGDYVTHDGAVTTYGTATVHGPTDTYARVIDTVATGAGSIFDGVAFNGRTALTDGRAVAGTYYESFFLTDAGYRSLGIVFFQDDAETARSAAVPASTGPLSTPVPAPAIPPVPAPVAAAPGHAPVASEAPRVVTPAPVGTVVPGVELPGPEPAPPPPAAAVPEPTPAGSVEVLRGRRVEIWLRGLPAGAIWRVVGGEAVPLGPVTGGAAEPFVARWDRLPPSGSRWSLGFEITVVGGPTRVVMLGVTVRSPGLVE
ncbi:MAG: hypothetical protein NVS9B6_18860 [Candidatus Limnocylindrales bacterium]